MPVKPNLNAFLLCDQVLRDQHGRCSLIGVFQHLRAQGFPLPPRNFSVFLSISEVVAPAKLLLSFKDPLKGQLLQEVPIDCVNSVEPNQPYEINADFANVVFDREGEWIFELRADGQLLSIRSLQVSKL
jgi:hypothetical protein